jgi:hypothetical protein
MRRLAICYCDPKRREARSSFQSPPRPNCPDSLFFANTANQSFVRSAADIRHSEFRCAASVSSLSPSQSWPGMPFSDFLLPAFTWHGFGRNSCVLDTALLLLSAAPPKEFCSLPSPKVENSFGPPQNAVARSGSRRRSLFAPK